MERKIGEIFEYNGEWYQCLEGTGCHKCDFNIDENTCGIGNPYCTGRSDKKDVIFKKLEKVGEPYPKFIFDRGNIKVQRYKLYCPTNTNICTGVWIYHWNENLVDIEIKQNKEDMEEKTIKIKKEDIKVGSKVIYLPSNRPYVITEANCRMKYDGDWHDCVIYTPLYDNPYKCFVRPIKDFAQNFVLDSAEEKEEKHSNLENTGKNLKPFDLQKAKAGKPVCTRDGRKARIICFDYVGETGDYPIVALVSYNKGNNCYERVLKYTSDGLFNKYGDYKHDDDLMMLPEKKEGWAVISRNDIYETEEKAKEVLLDSRIGVMIRKVEMLMNY